jgi:hypothetical protein
VLLPKILSQAPYNKGIVDRIGLQGMKFLRAVLWYGELVDVEYSAGLPQDLRQLAAFLGQLLDQIE